MNNMDKLKAAIRDQESGGAVQEKPIKHRKQ